MFGRGRGRGRFGGGFRVGSEKPFECFPGIELPDQKKVALDKAFARYNFKLQAYWENSAYFVGEGASEKRCQNEDIERFSDSKRPRYQTKQQSFSDYMKLAPGYFPLELVQGVKVSRAPKKVKWSASTDSKKLDFLEKLDNKSEGKKDDEDEGGEEEEEQEDEEYSDDGDYEQNIDFDDDDDDFNDADDGDDEPCY